MKEREKRINMFSFFSCPDHHYNILCPEMTIERKTPCRDESQTFSTFSICSSLPWGFKPRSLDMKGQGSRRGGPAFTSRMSCLC